MDEESRVSERQRWMTESGEPYRTAVHELNSTLKGPTERAEARALIAGELSGY